MPDPAPFAVPTRFEADTGRVALIIPGAGYSPARPLLHFARAVLLQHGWTVQELWWQIPEDFRQLSAEERATWVEGQVGAAVDAEDGACRLLVGKSLGSLAAGFAADRQIPAAWLTPLLTSDQVVRSLERATAPALLVGGTGDELWDVRIARELPHQILEIPSADHALEIPDDAVASAGLLQQVVSRLDRFIGSL